MHAPRRPRAAALLLALCALPARGEAQRAPIGDGIREFVSVDAAVVALTRARLIDGTGAPAREGVTLVVAGDPSRAIGDVRRVETVFRQGVGFDAQKLVQSVSGRVGLW